MKRAAYHKREGSVTSLRIMEVACSGRCLPCQWVLIARASPRERPPFPPCVRKPTLQDDFARCTFAPLIGSATAVTSKAPKS
jgi:hypothetical protein